MEENKELEEMQIDDIEENEEETEQQEVSKDTKPKSIIKIREEKAKKSLLKQLGVSSVDEAKEKFQKSEEALRRVEELEKKLINEQKSRETETKRSQLINLLDSENAFDSEALLNYIELDNIELDSSNKLKDTNVIIEQLKKIKPHYFTKQVVKGDNFVKGSQSSNQQSSNTDPFLQTVDYLKRIKK